MRRIEGVIAPEWVGWVERSEAQQSPSLGKRRSRNLVTAHGLSDGGARSLAMKKVANVMAWR